MRELIAVNRYAEAFLGFIKESIGIEKGMKDLKNIRGLLRDNPDFKEFLEHLNIDVDEKLDVIDKVLGDDFSEESKIFLRLLLDKRHIDLLSGIADYVRIKYSHANEVEAVLKSTYPLDLDLVKDIKDKLEKKFHKKLNLYIDYDPDLLGGCQVIIGHKIIDGSVKKRLGDLKEKLMLLKVE